MGNEQGISLAREIRGQIFVWIGIVGGALTIVNHWSNFITLADWIRLLVSYLSLHLHQFWSFLGTFINVSVPVQLSNFLSLLLFYSSLTIGTILMTGARRKGVPDRGELYFASILLMVTFAVFSKVFAEAERYLVSISVPPPLANLLGALFFIGFTWLIPAYYAPTRPLIRRLIFMLIGAAIIFGLSEASKLAERLHTAATTVQTQH